MTVDIPEHDPLVLDLGTGFRAWGDTLLGPVSPALPGRSGPGSPALPGRSGPGSPALPGRSGPGPSSPVRANVLLTHLHFDHVQGLPFFEPLDREGARLDVFGPQPDEGDLQQAFSTLVQPPYFPVRTAERRGEIRFHDVENECFTIGEAAVTVRSIPHLGPTNGYRVAWRDASLAYISDHQAPQALDRVPEAVLELAEGVDLLIHDAQFTQEEWQQKSAWGHSTIEFAVLVAREAGARRLALFHHDPAHDDDQIDRLFEQAKRTGDRLGVDEVLAAAEGLILRL